MDLQGTHALVTGGASGLGAATAKRLIREGSRVVIFDLLSSDGAAVAAELGSRCDFVAGDVTNPEEIAAAVERSERDGPLRSVVHCAGIGRIIRLVDKDGAPGSLEDFLRVINVNLVGTYNVLRVAAARMADNDEIDGERGAIVLTSSVAAFEGQIGQIAYSASKGGVAAMTVVAARDLAKLRIRVATIAPGLFETPLLGRLREDLRNTLAASVPNPPRLGSPHEYADLAATILRNGYLNGEVIRLDGALRMAPR